MDDIEDRLIKMRKNHKQELLCLKQKPGKYDINTNKNVYLLKQLIDLKDNPCKPQEHVQPQATPSMTSKTNLRKPVVKNANNYDLFHEALDEIMVKTEQ